MADHGDISITNYEYSQAMKRKLKLIRKRNVVMRGRCATISSEINNALDESLLKLVPDSISEKYDNNSGVKRVGEVMLFLFTIIMSVTTYQNYMSSRTTTFISSDKTPQCEFVTKSVSFDLLIDSRGYWEGQALFRRNFSYWSLNVNGLNATNEEFSSTFNYALVELSSIRQYAKTWAWPELYAYTLSFLSEKKIPQSDGTKLPILLTSKITPSAMFKGPTNSMLGTSGLYSRDPVITAKCSQFLTRTTTQDGSKMRITYANGYHPSNYSQLYSMFECDKILSPQTFRYSPQETLSNFTVKQNDNTEISFSSKVERPIVYEYDLTSVFIAYGVNMQLAGAKSFQLVSPNLFFELPEHYALVIHSSYPDMEPMACTYFKGKPLCFVTYSIEGDTYGLALPSVVSVGRNLTGNSTEDFGWRECKCPLSTMSETDQKLCTVPIFGISLLGHSLNIRDLNITNQFISESTHSLENDLSKFTNYGDFSSHVYNLTRNVNLPNCQKYPKGPECVDTSTRNAQLQSDFSFCTPTSSADCYVFSSSLIKLDYAINSLGSEILSICSSEPAVSNTTFEYISPFLGEEALQRLTTTPPTSLTESYYKCTNSIQDSLISAIGTAYGLTQSIMAFLGITLVPLIIYLFRKFKILELPKVEYLSADRDDVLYHWADTLLRLRDGDSSGLPSGDSSILFKVQEELLHKVRYAKKAEMAEAGVTDIGVTQTAAQKALEFLDKRDSDDDDEIEMGNMRKKSTSNVNENPMHQNL